MQRTIQFSSVAFILPELKLQIGVFFDSVLLSLSRSLALFCVPLVPYPPKIFSAYLPKKNRVSFYPNGTILLVFSVSVSLFLPKIIKTKTGGGGHKKQNTKHPKKKKIQSRSWSTENVAGVITHLGAVFDVYAERFFSAGIDGQALVFFFLKNIKPQKQKHTQILYQGNEHQYRYTGRNKKKRELAVNQFEF